MTCVCMVVLVLYCRCTRVRLVLEGVRKLVDVDFIFCVSPCQEFVTFFLFVSFLFFFFLMAP